VGRGSGYDTGTSRQRTSGAGHVAGAAAPRRPRRAASRHPHRRRGRDALVHRPAVLQRSPAVARSLPVEYVRDRRSALDLSRRGEFYAAGFLTENERLPWGRVLGNTSPPAIPRLTERSTASQFDQIAIQPPRNASYHVGDSLLIARVDRDIEGWGGVVVPLGVARVTELQRRQVLADVIMQFGRIHDGHLAMPLEPFKDPGLTRPTPVEQGLEGHVVAARDLHDLADLQQILFINRGRAEGVTPGDVFEVFRPASGVPGTSSEEVRM